MADRGSWSFFDPAEYTYDLTLFLSEPMKFDEVRGMSHPDDSQLIIGNQCGDGPTYAGAAVILGRMSATATTKGFDTPIKTNIAVGVEGASANKYDLTVAQNFSNGGSCSTGQYFGTKFNQPVATGSSVNSPFFIVIKGYYDSAPEGDTQYGHDAYLQPRGKLAGDPQTANEYRQQYRTNDDKIARLVP